MKRLLGLLLCLCMTLGICACGQKAVEEISPWQKQYDLGIRYLSEGNYEEAIIAFTAAIEIDAKQPLAFISRADAYIGSGETAETLASALADYETAVGLDEANPDGWLGLADVYIRQGDLAKAREVLEQALSKISGNQALADKLDELNSGSVTDSSGQSRMMISYDGSGNITFWHAYTYDGEGREASVTSYAPDGSQTGYVELTYAPSGARLSSYSWATETGEVSKMEYVLDENDHTVKQIWYDSTGAVKMYVLYENDANGNPVKSEQYSADGTLWGYEIHSSNNGIDREEHYDPDHRLTGYTEWKDHGTYYYNGDGSLTSYTINLYDDDGNHIGFEDYDADGTLQARQIYE